MRTLLWVSILVLGYLTKTASGQLVLPPTIDTDTVLTASMNPIRVAQTTTVAPGATLTLEAGVIIEFFDSTCLIVRGDIVALGSAGSPVTFRALVPGTLWQEVRVVNSVDDRSRFEWCHFRDAQTGLVLQMHSVAHTSSTPALDCTFESCENGILGDTLADRDCGSSCCGSTQLQPHLNPEIRRCRFLGIAGNAIEFSIKGQSLWNCWTSPPSYSAVRSYAAPEITNNLFDGIGGAAIYFTPVSYTGASEPLIANNTIHDAAEGIFLRDPFDSEVRSNIFRACAVGIQRTGSLNATVDHNLFWENAENFVGYPVSYGVVLPGTDPPEDVFENRITDPLWSGFFELDLASPAIDAACSSSFSCSLALYDDAAGCALSLGGPTGDLGWTGGPHACSPLSNSISFAET